MLHITEFNTGGNLMTSHSPRKKTPISRNDQLRDALTYCPTLTRRHVLNYQGRSAAYSGHISRMSILFLFNQAVRDNDIGG